MSAIDTVDATTLSAIIIMGLKKYITPIFLAVGLALLLLSVVVDMSGRRDIAFVEQAWQAERASLDQMLSSDLGPQDLIKALEAEDWNLEWRRPDGTLRYWTSTKDTSLFAFQHVHALQDASTLHIFRFEQVQQGEYEASSLLSTDITLDAPTDEVLVTAKTFPFVTYYAATSTFVGYWWQYAGLLGYLFILGGWLWFISRKLKARYAAIGLLLTLLGTLLLPIERLWSDLIMSHGMMQLGTWAITLTDLVSITAIALGGALLVSSKSVNYSLNRSVSIIYGITTAALLLCILRLAQGIIAHPSIQLEVTKIFRFDKYSIIVLICLATMSISHLVGCMYLWYDGRKAQQDTSSTHLIYVLLGVLLSGGVYWLIGLDIPYLTIYLFMVSYYTMIDLYLDAQRRNVTWLIWWILILSAFLSVSVFYMSLLKGQQSRSAFVEEYLTPVKSPDQALELDAALQASPLFDLLSEVGEASLLSREDILEFLSVKSGTAASDFSDVDISAFAENGVSLFMDASRGRWGRMQQWYRSSAVSPFVRYDYVDHSYIHRYEVLSADTSSIEVFFDHGEGAPTTTVNTPSYILYKEGIPVYSPSANQHGIDPASLLAAVLDDDKLAGYDIASAQQGPFQIVAYSRLGSLIKPISLFSYLFLLIGLAALLIAVANSRFRLMRPPLSLKFSSRSTLRNKIQLVVLLMVLFSFVVIGVLTALYLRTSLAGSNDKVVLQQSRAIANQIRGLATGTDGVVGLADVALDELDQLSQIHDLPLAMYDGSTGLLLKATTDLADAKMPFDAFSSEELRMGSSLSSKAQTYLPILEREGLAAVVDIQHGASFDMKRSVFDFLSTIVNVYVFLFLLGGAIAIIIANSITRPLTDLGEKLKSIKLGKTNESLEWKGNDEIGDLIQDYNNLIIDLERSANIIAMTERDTAWREMAKQVAHEIKNPLTPMKLSIQYLQRAGQSAAEGSDLIERVSKTLIEQIDNLTQIANEFSNFAAMPMASNEKLLLNDIVEMIHELFRKREDMDIHLIEPITDLWVYADKNHLIRILNNILKNAIQAIPEDRRGNIVISLYQRRDVAIVEVKDNGAGIPLDKQNKVFTPNFTTKSSGTGLGLAISANMIEAFNGRIYFETVVGTGTSFFVEVPLMRLDHSHDGKHRVLLD